MMQGRDNAFGFGMILVMGILLSRNSSQICLHVLCLEKSGFLTWLFLHQKWKGVGIYNSIELFIIGSWRVYVLFLRFFIPNVEG